MMTDLEIFKKIDLEGNAGDSLDSSSRKVTIVGVGQVGMACAYSILQQSIASEIALVDVMGDKLKGEMMDLQHGLAFISNCRLSADTDYKVSAGSKLCIITAGVRQNEGEDRISLVQRNAKIFEKIVPMLVRHSPDTLILVVSNPAWKLSGLPRNRVFGSGTNLDTARFRFILSQKLNIAPSSCHGWIIGEHGDSSVPVWSGVNVCGMKLLGSDAETLEEMSKIHQEVVKSAYDIITLKGFTSWAIGLSVAAIARAVFFNTKVVLALSTNVKGLHSTEEDVFLSLPCVVGIEGVSRVVNLNLNDLERSNLEKSIGKLQNVQQNSMNPQAGALLI